MNVKKNCLLFFVLIFLVSLVSSAPPVTTVQEFPEGYVIVESSHEYLKQNQDYQYNFFVYNKSSGILIDNDSMTCNFFLANSSGEVIFSQEVIYFPDGHWDIDILGGNFSNIGSYPYGVSCQDSSGGALAGILEVNLKGEEQTTPLLFGYIILIGFFIITIFSYEYLNTKVNYEKWNNKIMTKYQDRNYIKLVMSSIGYNLLKNKFVIYYLLGIPIMVLLTDLSATLNIAIMTQLLNVLSSIYLWCAVLIGLYFFGYVQEWLKDLFDKFKDLNWGMGE